jgi:hypothetical protein
MAGKGMLHWVQHFFCESNVWPEHAFGMLIAVKDLHCLPPFILQSTIIASTPFATAV